jgi:Uma2 family endonuclease
MLAPSAVWPDRIRPLKRVEYDRLVESGLLDESRVELLLGVLIDRSPQGPRHAQTVNRLAERFIRELPGHVHTRVQSPLAVSDDSEPEPDLAVVPAAYYAVAHPRAALLIVEVAETSVVKDRSIKTALYARAGVPELWLVNLPENVIEVHRHPSAGRYADVHTVASDGVLQPEAFPSLRIAAVDVVG